MDRETLLKECRLDNGLNIKFFDQSKKIAIDRFYLCILMRVVVPVEKRWFNEADLSKIKFDEIVKLLGNQVVFEKKQERHFVDASLKEKLIDLITINMLDTSAKYFRQNKFPEKLILKRFDENYKRWRVQYR